MRLPPFISLILYCVCFATYFTIQQTLLHTGLNPLYLNTLTYSSAAILFSIYVVIYDRSSLAIRSKRGVVISIVVAIISSVLADIMVLFGLRTGSSITWSLLVCLAPLITYLLAMLLLGDGFAIHKIAGVLASIVGAVIVIYIPGTGIDWVHGAPYFISAVILFGITNILTQYVFRYVTPIQLTLIKMISASLIVIPFLPLLHIPIVTPNWALIFFSGLVLLVANLLVNHIIHVSGATYFSVGSNMAPLFVTLFSVIFINNWPTFTQILGGLVIIGGILMFKSVHLNNA